MSKLILMSKLIRDLGAGKTYTLAVSTSSAGVELIARPGDVPRDRVPLETIALALEEVMHLIYALGDAYYEAIDRPGGGPPGMVGRRDLPETLNRLRDDALRIAVEHGFTDASVGEDVALFHSEASELLEDHREGRQPTKVWYETKREGTGASEHNEGGMVVFTRTITVSEWREPLNDDGSLRKPCGIPSECADLIIRVLHFCGKHGIDIEKAVREKMAYNESRPHKHGKTL